MGHLMNIKCVDSRVNVHVLSSKRFPFTLTTVQVPKLALTQKKRITVQWCRTGPDAGLPMPAALASMPMPSYATNLHFRSAITISLHIINVPSYHRRPNYMPGLSLSLSPLWSLPPPPRTIVTLSLQTLAVLQTTY